MKFAETTTATHTDKTLFVAIMSEGHRNRPIRPLLPPTALRPDRGRGRSSSANVRIFRCNNLNGCISNRGSSRRLHVRRISLIETTTTITSANLQRRQVVFIIAFIFVCQSLVSCVSNVLVGCAPAAATTLPQPRRQTTLPSLADDDDYATMASLPYKRMSQLPQELFSHSYARPMSELRKRSSNRDLVSSETFDPDTIGLGDYERADIIASDISNNNKRDSYHETALTSNRPDRSLLGRILDIGLWSFGRYAANLSVNGNQADNDILLSDVQTLVDLMPQDQKIHRLERRRKQLKWPTEQQTKRSDNHLYLGKFGRFDQPAYSDGADSHDDQGETLDDVENEILFLRPEIDSEPNLSTLTMSQVRPVADKDGSSIAPINDCSDMVNQFDTT